MSQTMRPNSKSTSPSKRKYGDWSRGQATSLEDLAEILAGMNGMNTNCLEEPKTLLNTEECEISNFIEHFAKYRANGGLKEVTCFIEESVLDHIRMFELENEHASSMEILEFLKKELKATDEINLDEQLQEKVRIDQAMSTGKEKLRSLFRSLNKAMKSFGLKEDVKDIDGLSFAFEHQMSLILSKLPTPFVSRYQIWSKYKPRPTSTKELYKQLAIIEEKYDGTWQEKPINEQNYTELENDYLKEFDEHQAKGMKTRSKKSW